MNGETGPKAGPDTLQAQDTAPDLCRLRRWADLAAFALDNPGREAVDALLLLGDELEDALEAAIAAEGRAAA
jgi:hypothetical protein